MVAVKDGAIPLVCVLPESGIRQGTLHASIYRNPTPVILIHPHAPRSAVRSCLLSLGLSEVEWSVVAPLVAEDLDPDECISPEMLAA